MDYTIKIGAEAGQGLQTIGPGLARVFSRAGYHVFCNQDYESRVRGGHNLYQIRFSDKPIGCLRERVDVLVALDAETIPLHLPELAEHGTTVYDSLSLKKTFDDPRCLDVSFSGIAQEAGGNHVMANTAALGAILGMLGMEVDPLLAILEDSLGNKGGEVVEANLRVARAGHDAAKRDCPRCDFQVAEAGPPRMILDGAQALALGAIASGCNFYSGYPMTPSTGIMQFLSARSEEFGILVEQAEDEISAINMVLGASFAGARAMTATSGGGFALMVEGLSLAAMTETPVVIGLGQRPGPATGLPTRTEQADLLYATFAAHGEFPRVIFAPGDLEQAFFLINKAFDLTEKYQVPAIVLFDQYLADILATVEPFELERLRGVDYRLRGEAFRSLGEYRRYAYDESGVSPLAVPGDAPHLVVADSDEHDQDGHLIEDKETRVRMVEKRLHNKLPRLRTEMAPPLLYGDDDPETVLIGWGSTLGLLREAVDELSGGRRIALLHFSEVYPFPATDRFDYLSLLGKAKRTICVENNARGQFALLLRQETGFKPDGAVLKYDGRPFTLEGLLEELNDAIT